MSIFVLLNEVNSNRPGFDDFPETYTSVVGVFSTFLLAKSALRAFLNERSKSFIEDTGSEWLYDSKDSDDEYMVSIHEVEKGVQ